MRLTKGKLEIIEALLPSPAQWKCQTLERAGQRLPALTTEAATLPSKLSIILLSSKK